MMRLARLGLRRDRSCPPAHKLLASELAIGDKLEVDRGRRVDAVRSVARHDGSRTVDCLFESGRRRTYQFDADVSIRSH